MSIYTHRQIASDYTLWAEYFDTDGNMSKDEFDALTVEQAVATPIEQQMSGVDNMDYMYSINANNGQSTLYVNFALGTDANTDTHANGNRDLALNGETYVGGGTSTGAGSAPGGGGYGGSSSNGQAGAAGRAWVRAYQ